MIKTVVLCDLCCALISDCVGSLSVAYIPDLNPRVSKVAFSDIVKRVHKDTSISFCSNCTNDLKKVVAEESLVIDEEIF